MRNNPTTLRFLPFWHVLQIVVAKTATRQYLLRRMRGSFLRELRVARGHTGAWVAARAGYSQPTYSKIESKKDISVEEFERVMSAMGLRAGDYLDNSNEEIRPLLPIVAQLQKFSPNVLPRVSRMLEEMALAFEENLLNTSVLREVAHETIPSVPAYNGKLNNNTGKTDSVGAVTVPRKFAAGVEDDEPVGKPHANDQRTSSVKSRKR